MTNLKALLKKLGACADAVAWCNGKELREAWDTCERADWMLWLCGRMIGKDGWPTRQQIVLLACRFAEDALPSFEKKYPQDDRPRKCIEITRQWAKGLAIIEQVRQVRTYHAADAAYGSAAAYAASAAYAAAAYADASAAAYAASASAYADAADAAASAAADAADAASADAASADAASADAASADAYADAYAAYAASAAADAAYADASAMRSAKLKEYSDIIRKELRIPVEANK